MKWAFSIRRKISAALLLAAIFVLLFVKNMLDSKNVSQLGNSFSSVYEDRLLVESYIYKMSDHLFRKKIMIDTAEGTSAALQVQARIDVYNKNIREIIDAYDATKLTEAESVYFAEFKKNVSRLMELEDQYFKSIANDQLDPHFRQLITTQFNQASANLDLLSGIQISEGKMLNDHTQKIVAGSSLLTQFETGILIAIGLMVLALVFESSRVFNRTGTQQQSLN